jgi:N-methylhydantoinase A
LERGSKLLNDARRTVHVSVDIGGTFTDVVAVDVATGRYEITKASTTAADLVCGVRAGTEAALAALGASPGDVARFVHGTTIGTNAILERRGAVTAVLATEGFEDVLEMGRLKRTRMYDLLIDAETPVFLAPRRRRRGVRERIGPDGEVVVPLDHDCVRKVVESLVRDEGARAFAVSLLFSFRNPAHEAEVRRIIRTLDPSLSVSISSEVDPMFREYERTVVTAFDAYVRPVIEGYVERLTHELGEIGIDAPLQVMQSRGGITAAELASHRPVSILLSGPAAGVIGARHAGAQAGFQNVISIDVGGTSADVSLVRAGAPLVTDEGMIDTYPLRVPMVDVTTIGAGGGSIAWVDAGGNFHVGPISAGADPGPICYGRGGTRPTVTDASLVLGYLNPSTFAGGTVQLDVEAARAGLRQLGSALGLSAEQAAAGVHRVVNSRMADAIRLVSIKRGFDPRDFALVLLGGAGPVHGGRLAAELDIPTQVVPAVPGVLSALGLLVASVEHDAAETIGVRADQADPAALETAFRRLEQRTAELMARDRAPAEDVVTARFADGRYAGQAYTLAVAGLAPAGPSELAAYVQDFHGAHARVYGHALPSAPVEVVNLRVVQSWRLPEPELLPRRQAERPAGAGATRRAYFDELGGFVDVPVMTRDGLSSGMRLEGPAIVEQADTTTVVYPGHRLIIDLGRNLVVSLTGESLRRARPAEVAWRDA